MGRAGGGAFLLFYIMKTTFSITLLLSALLPLSAAAQHVGDVFGFPSAEPGYSLGVSACYAGQIGDMLVVAGGCNFPTAGHKTYYRGIYAARADRAVLNWQLVGLLPEAAAYGATVASGDSLLFIGGNNADHLLSAVYSLHLTDDGQKATVRRLPSLPHTADNMAAAKCGNTVYIVGGNQDGQPSAGIMTLSLDGQARSADCTRMPGSPRVQPVAAATDGQLYVWGGFFADGQNSIVHTDGCRFDVASGQWSGMSAPHAADGEEMTLSGGTAWTDGRTIYATGGVNKEIFLDAISGRYECVGKDDYLKQPIAWYRFSGNLYTFDTAHSRWQPTVFASSALARAGAQPIPTKYGVFYIGGELKPALRTPQIVLLK